MYQKFCITSIETDAINKRIVVETTHDIDDKSIDYEKLQLLDCATENFVAIGYEVIGSRLYINLPFYPTPNNKYILMLSEIFDITGTKLDSSIRYNLVFESSIFSKPVFIKPAFAEEIENLVIEFDEIFPSVKKPGKVPPKPQDHEPPEKQPAEQLHEKINSFYIELSTDNLFFNIVYTTSIVDTNKVDLIEMPSGQYYARARVQKDNEYGQWSDVVTFVLKHTHKQPPQIEDEIFEKPLRIISVPKDGDDCDAFYIEFDEEVDIDTLDNIVVTRRML